ncbi:TVP38/TMEM64 family protein [Salipaludibacillus neizhouensis]|uniref:TVP38/TMEM64 family membrane protein n=1 Tax=Salipaludibacillus neizhouensis TaxID=885475 RepID=A0A3A9KFK5_9BACI|nr:TVP38/TMEM64 family protein [Salipaludibacillus neizhouensis]RKL69352.1 TVP38/TMEM64 family protein [Salipaludibacillus neizhouensis]
MPFKLIIKILVFLILIGSLLYFNFAYIDINPDHIQVLMQSFGIWAPLVFIGIFTIRPFVLFPASILAIAGGLSFGPFIGPLVTYIGSLSGAAVSFLVFRKLGANLRKKNWNGKGSDLQLKIEENGFFYIMALRIIPVINFDFVSYLSALSRIKFRKYFGATMVGIIPGTLAFNFLGASFVDLNLTMILITSGLFIVAFSIPIIIRRIMKKKNIDIDLLPDEKL